MLILKESFAIIQFYYSYFIFIIRRKNLLPYSFANEIETNSLKNRRKARFYLCFILWLILMEIYTSRVCKNKKHWNNLRCKNPPPLIFTKNLFCLETKKNHQLHSNKMAIVFVRGAHNVFMWFFAYTLWLILQPCRMIYEFASVLWNLNTIPPLFFAFDMLLLFLLVPIFCNRIYQPLSHDFQYCF